MQISTENNTESHTDTSTEILTPKPYQLEGIDFLLARRFALLADEMGLGKSAQVILAAEKLKPRSIVIVCPAIARVNWQREFQKWAPRSFPKFQALFDSKTELYGNHWVVSYDLLWAYAPKFPERIDLLVLDESHFVKDPYADRTKDTLGSKGLAHRSNRIWCLSGTPAPNHPGELWPLLYTFKLIPWKYDDFVDKFCLYYKYLEKRVITGAKAKTLPELKSLLKLFMLRRKVKDVLPQLPKVTITTLPVKPGRIELDIYTSFIKYVFPHDNRPLLMKRIEEETKLLELGVNAANRHADTVIKTLEAFSRSVSTLRRFVAVQKIQPIVDLVIDELDRNVYKKVVIFGISRDFTFFVRDKLKYFGAVSLYGGLDPKTRQANIDRFQKNPKHRVMVANIQAASTAISLTAANHIIFGEASWNPGENAQAISRCRRIGQTKPVFVRFVELDDSIDQKITQILKRKAQFFVSLFDGQMNQNEELIGFQDEIEEAKYKALGEELLK